jgi:hypothetical protein
MNNSCTYLRDYRPVGRQQDRDPLFPRDPRHVLVSDAIWKVPIGLSGADGEVRLWRIFSKTFYETAWCWLMAKVFTAKLKAIRYVPMYVEVCLLLCVKTIYVNYFN